MKRLFILLLLVVTTLNASFSEDKFKAMIIGKVAKYVVWNKKESTPYFNITILNNPFGSTIDTIYHNKRIDGKEVKIHYIDTIDQLTQTQSDILYIPNSQASQLQNILDTIKGKGIFTISDIRGFAQKGGMLQLYFISRKIKLKINLESVKEENLNIRSTLLRIAKVIKEENE